MKHIIQLTIETDIALDDVINKFPVPFLQVALVKGLTFK